MAWRGLGHYVDIGALFLKKMHVHVKELECKYLKFKLNPRERKTVDIEFWFRGGFDTAPISSSENWFIGQIADSLVHDSLGDLWYADVCVARQ